MLSFRSLLLWGAVATALPSSAQALPAWARRYNMNCSGCHAPAVPRLNATGIAFKWAGYRMPDDIGKAVEVQKIENYVAARIIGAYDIASRKGEGRETDGFSMPSASMFAAGPLGKYFGAYLEFERVPDASIDLIGSVSGLWGSEKRYGGFRLAQGHMLLAAGGVAGYDRPTAISAPLAYEESVTESIPLRLGGDQAGVELFTVVGGRNRTSIQLLNGLVLGSEMEGAAVSKKDIVLTNQLMWDDAGSGLGLTAYFGNASGLVTDQPTIGTRYYRLSATANKIVDRFEVMGGYLYGSDKDVPVAETQLTATRSPTGHSWWVQGQYTLDKQMLTVFSRYEFVNLDRTADDASRQRYMLGAVLPINLPEYLRWSIEVYRDAYRASAVPQRNGLSTQLQVVY